MTKAITIGALAAASGIKVTTIRFYERAGLMPVPARTPGRHRVYTSEHLRRLRFIRRSRDLQFSIEDIRRLLMLAEPERASCCEIQHVAAVHLSNLRHEITRLMKLETALANALERCSGKPVPPCPVLELLNSVA